MNLYSKLGAFFFLIFFVEETFSQNVPTVWYLGAGQSLHFTSSPATSVIEGSPDNTASNGKGYATCTDQHGNVLFYTDGKVVMRGPLPLENGTDLFGTQDRQIIVPVPGTNSRYYIFYLGYDFIQHIQLLKYAIVEVKDITDPGKVLTKNNLLYSTLHGYFAIAPDCTNKNFWLVGEADRDATEGTDKIFSYLIAPDGISQKMISTPLPMKQSGGYHFSPDGSKLFFWYKSTDSEGSGVADFDRATGVVSNFTKLGPCCGFGEFSSGNKKLFISYPSSTLSKLVQYRLDGTSISVDTVSTVNYNSDRLQMGVDGKIYQILLTKDSIARLGVVMDPENIGQDCDYNVVNAFSLNAGIGKHLTLPEFPTNLFYKSPYKTADAGADKEVCMGTQISIGVPNPTNQNYQWVPNQYLSNPNSDQTNFSYNEQIDSTRTLMYILKGLGNECVNPDTMLITVRPRPAPSIFGSRSVCPGVVDVKYFTEANSNFTYAWNVAGGNIDGDNHLDSVKINWGGTNAQSNVRLTVGNQYNCISNEEVFPVKINVQLDTETPQGLLNVCANLIDDNNYQIENTNGSIYTWGVQGGNIAGGQGSNKVLVSWQSSGLHQLWVTERSTTKDTICFGASDTLSIKVFKDSLALNLDVVSVNPSNDSKTSLAGSILNLPSDFKTVVSIMRKKEDETAWENISTASPAPDIFFEDDSLNTDSFIYDYRLSTTNGCQQEVTSKIHNTIRGQATGEEDVGKIGLQWNPYAGWNNVDHYEIWRKIDSDTSFSKVGIVNNELFELSDANKGFKHHFLVKAFSSTGNLYSWSNQFEVEFEHPLFIPNVFTPNGDKTNETFTIKHIELYPQNELLIYNRYGEAVYSRRNYDNTWNGENLSSGVYYYHLRFPDAGKNQKGWVQIIR